MLKQHLEMIEIGCLFFLAVYHIILFFQVRRKSYLFLGLLVTMVMVRALLVDDGSGLLFQLLPGLDKLEGRKIEYFVTYTSLFLVPMFINALYPYVESRKYVIVMQVIGGFLALTVLITPYSFFKQTLNVFHLSMIGSFVLVFYILYRAVRAGRTGSSYILIGVSICFVFVLVEMMKNSRVIPHFDTAGPNLVNTGVVLFFFFQTIALSSIYARSFNENEQLNRELEDRVAARTEQLSQSNIIKERFIQIIGHDLRAPLGSLKSMLGLMSSGKIPPEKSAELASKIEENVSGSIKILDDLMEWTKARSHAKPSMGTKDRINLMAIIAETVLFFQEVARDKEITLVFQQNDEEVFVTSEANATKAVVRNLLSNALKFTEVGGSVEVGFERKGGNVEVFVSDTGIGMPDEMKLSIFEMQSKNRRTGTGNERSTGVGLSLCKDLLSQNGGKIWVEDNKPKGTIFRFAVSDAG